MTHATLSATGQARLRDGRRLGYAASGARGGAPVLYFHGAIGSPVRRCSGLERSISELGLRYLTVDRPGFGASDPSPGRRVADFAADVEDLADHLGLDRFGIVGVSAGAPYALACARALGERLTAATVVSAWPPGLRPARASGMSAPIRAGLSALVAWPGAAARAGEGALAILRRRPDLLGRALAFGATGADRRLMREPEAREIAIRSFFAAAERGVAPMIEDYVVCCSPWGFSPAEIRAEVHLWHGTHDRLVPARHVRALAGSVPGCRATLVEGEGHFFFRAHLPRILAPLARRSPASRSATRPRRRDLAA